MSAKKKLTGRPHKMPKRATRNPIVCFEVYRNGKKVRTAGVKKGMLVFDLIYFTGRHSIPRAMHFRLAGIERKTDDDDGRHVHWSFMSAKPGDEFSVRIVESATCDRPTRSRPTANRKRRPVARK
ncbi:MAG: hypothetical protein HY290_32105 [Planctomycetia bacterium]|nr:hypothetical protein [Planctomycetia bacterium]